MKITKNYLTKVIKEEVQKVLKEQREDMTPRTKLYLRDLTVGAYKNAGGAAARAGGRLRSKNRHCNNARKISHSFFYGKT